MPKEPTKKLTKSQIELEARDKRRPDDHPGLSDLGL
jgi:nuclear transport factor 2 (NTF2) superfamily protein